MPGVPQTLPIPPLVNEMTMLNAIRLAAGSGGGGGGTGNVAGPATSTNNAVALWDGATGKLLKDSSIFITGGGTIALGGFTLTVPNNGTAALLGTAQTFTAANIFSVNGSASTPAMTLNGAIFTGGTSTTTKPLFLIEPSGTTSNAWSTSGTFLGINLPVGFSGNAISLCSSGEALPWFNFSFDQGSGSASFGPPASGFGIYGGSFYPVPVNGIRLGRAGVSAWTGLGLTSAAPIEWNSDAGLTRSGTGALKVTDGGAGYGSLIASALTVNTGGALKLGNAAVTGLIAGALAALTTASITIQDSTGTTYRIPCII